MERRDPFYDSPEWLKARYKALKLANGYCQCCGFRGDADNPLQVDHIKPRSHFPRLSLAWSNLQVLCRRCNLGKSNRDMTDWRWSPSRELEILNAIDPAKRFRLQQLGWLKINGENGPIRQQATRDYRALWREIEAEWIASNKAAE
jgi:rubredoxin